MQDLFHIQKVVDVYISYLLLHKEIIPQIQHPKAMNIYSLTVSVGKEPRCFFNGVLCDGFSGSVCHEVIVKGSAMVVVSSEDLTEKGFFSQVTHVITSKSQFQMGCWNEALRSSPTKGQSSLHSMPCGHLHG